MKNRPNFPSQTVIFEGVPRINTSSGVFPNFARKGFTMIDPKLHAQNHGTLENLIRHIPGFRGYLDREERRESDFLVRKWMADRLQQCKQGLDDYLRTL